MATLDIHINDGYLRMVDGARVYHRGFGERPTALRDPAPSLVLRPRVFTADGALVAGRHYPLDAARPPAGRPEPAYRDPFNFNEYLVRRRHWASYFPERTLIAESGSRLGFRVHNHLAQAHSLAFIGASASGSHIGTGPIAPGAVALLEFDAPRPGTYLYCDPGTNSADPAADPVQRVLGLFGALLVMDPMDAWRPYPDGPEFERQWLWLLHNVDPEWARRASLGQRIDPATLPAYPRYFTLNGRSGFQALALGTDGRANEIREEETLISGSARQVDVRDFGRSATRDTVRTGQLLRLLNAGVVHHQLHFHGNHLWTVSRNGIDFPRRGGFVDAAGHVVQQQWEDVIEMHPLDRKDAVLPLCRPPETLGQVWDARTGDWNYPMHCHAEPSQVARGGMYPGGLVGHWSIAAPLDAPAPPVPLPRPPGTTGPATPSATPGTGLGPPLHEPYRSQVDFSSDQFHQGSPPTEFLQPPDRKHELKVNHGKMRFDARNEFELMFFELDDGGAFLPSPLIRLREGQVFHALLKPARRVHTLHWHGMEPDPRNDGVGHTSFEVSGGYTYQWKPEPGQPGNPNTGASGTYFYHCHVNTPLHVQLGMFGPLIIDPVPHPDFPVGAGGRRAFVDGPEYDIETETLLVPYPVDPAWHRLNHAAGLSGEDVGLDHFAPKHFYILGGELARRPRKEGPQLLTAMRANVVGGTSPKLPTLLRFLNAGYFPVNAYFTDQSGQMVRMGELISHDGRPFRDTHDPDGPSRPSYLTDGGRLEASLLNFGAAERYDMLLRPPKAGSYTLTVDLLHWITDEVLFRRTIPITAT